MHLNYKAARLLFIIMLYKEECSFLFELQNELIRALCESIGGTVFGAVHLER